MRVELAPAETETVSSLLWELNTTGIAETVPDRADCLGDRGGRAELLAGFDSRTDAESAANAVRREAGVEATIEPIDVDAWIDRSRTGALTLDDRVVPLEVGGAFGDGAHPTTTLTIALLATETAPGDSMLDVGTGTGILAIAASAYGAARIVAIDNDPAAIEVARSNLAATDTSGVTLADALPAAGTDAVFDVIAANVLLPVHEQLGLRIVELLAHSGSLVVSGVLVEQRHRLLAAYPTLIATSELIDGDWLGIVLEPTTA